MAADEVDAAFARGAHAWPELRATAPTFARIAQECRTRTATAGDAVAWSALNAPDVYLVAAVADGDAAAVAAFTRTLLEPCRGSLARLGLTPALVEDVLADLRQRILVIDDASGGLPPIARQTGEGNLAALVRVMAVRAGINRRQREQRYAPEEAGTIDNLIGTHSPSGVLLSEEAKQLLRRAIASAVSTLGERDQALLRLHVYHRMSIDDLGATYGVHRATAARWLAKIHDMVDTETRRALSDAMQTESDHLRSVLDAARTGLTSAFAAALGQG